jgi:hypothetical protein
MLRAMISLRSSLNERCLDRDDVGLVEPVMDAGMTAPAPFARSVCPVFGV